eukprot:c13613_g1_i1 orf=74-988(+)
MARLLQSVFAFSASLCPSLAAPHLNMVSDHLWRSPPSMPRASVKQKAPCVMASQLKCVEEKNPVRQLVSVSSAHNEITILEVPKDVVSVYSGSRLLLLDESGNIHSIYRKDSSWTGSYWDQFATLPPIVPDGPVAIFGLGGGTAARLILDLFPSCKLEAWEIDEILVDMARMYLGLSELESPTIDGTRLKVHIGDALSSSAIVDEMFAGIIVDLFAHGALLPQLQQVDTWLDLKGRLKPGGRIMINCGGIHAEDTIENGTWIWEDGGDATLMAMFQAFDHQIIVWHSQALVLILNVGQLHFLKI